ncbi:MAG: BrnA antitoxin family protein [Pseudomonadota bacterium]
MKNKYNGTREEDNIAELGDEFFRSAKRIGRPVSEHPKKRVSIRLSAAVVDKFRSEGSKGWHTRLSNFLDKAVEQGLV